MCKHQSDYDWMIGHGVANSNGLCTTKVSHQELPCHQQHFALCQDLEDWCSSNPPSVASVSIRLWHITTYSFLPTLSYMKVNHQCIFHAFFTRKNAHGRNPMVNPMPWKWHPQVITIAGMRKKPFKPCPNGRLIKLRVPHGFLHHLEKTCLLMPWKTSAIPLQILSSRLRQDLEVQRPALRSFSDWLKFRSVEMQTIGNMRRETNPRSCTDIPSLI